MEEWSKQRHVDHVALIYFQKMLQVLTSHTSKLPKKVLKNTKNMTPNSCSVRPEKFHPYTNRNLTYQQKTENLPFSFSLTEKVAKVTDSDEAHFNDNLMLTKI